MSTVPRRPWWYSGDEDASPELSSPEVTPTDELPSEVTSREESSSDELSPEVTPPEESSPEESSASAGLDWMSLLSGAQRMVDWATEKVMAPHAEHDDPAGYPECVVCRTIVLVGSSGSGVAAADLTGTADVPHAAVPIEWIPIRDAGTEEHTAG